MADVPSTTTAGTGSPVVTGRPRLHRTPLMLALAVFLISLAVTFGAWRIAHEEAAKNTLAEFDYQIRQTERRIEQRMQNYEQVQRGTQAFLLGDMNVRRDDFQLFIASLRLSETFPGIQGIALVPLIAPAQLNAYEAAVARTLPGFAVRPEGKREVYSTITHIEPLSGLNPRALGFDMLTDPTRREAMERARDTGQAAASGKVRLVQETGRNEQPGLVMYLPVYRRGMPVSTLQERRTSLVGWVGAPFRMGDLMAGLGGERARDIRLSIFDGKSSDPADQLYHSRDEGDSAGPHQAMFNATRHVVVGGRTWTLQFASTPVFEARQQAVKPLLIASAGILSSVMFGLIVWTLASGRRRAMVLATTATHQLSESEYRWQYALEGAGDGVWDWNSATGDVVYSRRWKQMLGFEEHEIADQPDEWERLLHPDDAPGVLAILDAYVTSTDQTYEAEYRMRCKDGSWRWIRGRGMAVTRDASGRPLRTIGTHTDITRLKESEAALRLSNVQLASEQHRVKVILEHSHDAFIAVAPDGVITDWSAKAEALLGWSTADAVGQQLAEMIVPPEFRAAHHAGFARFARTGQGTLVRSVVEVNALHRDGSLIPVELAIAGFPQEDGYAVSAFMRDISERKLAQRLDQERAQALEEARSALQHSQRLEAVGKLTGGIAHDFNNVLHIISGNVQLMQSMAGDNERLQKRLKSMQSAVERGAKLSSQLLSFARRQPLEPVVVNLRRTVGNMDDLLQRALGESVQIRIESDDDLWNALADPGQLENVILNLAINARDTMPDDGALTLSLENATVAPENTRRLVDMAAGDYVRLSVTDTGAGMTDEVKAAAFEPFFTTKPVGQGTGLGLSMAYGFVKQSGGHIQIDSEPGKGTSVVIFLPRCDQPERLTGAVKAETVRGGDETILVVEDDHEVRVTVVNTLIELGYRVLEACDGESAMRIIDSGIGIHVLFTDVVMPGPVSSTELATLAKQKLPGLAVLFTSGYTRNALVTDGRLDEGVKLLRKPYRREDLAKKMRDVLA
jgi:PAS domain S-box-containing protein